MTNLDSIFKSRDVSLPTKVRLVKAKVFPVVMYGCESWTVKKAECQRIDAFELWCWSRLLRVLECKEIQPKEISPEYSLKGMVLKLKVWYFGHLIWIDDSMEKTLVLGRIEGRRRRGDRAWDGWMASLPQWTWVWESSRSWCWTGKLRCCSPQGHKKLGHD